MAGIEKDAAGTRMSSDEMSAGFWSWESSLHLSVNRL